MNDSVFTVSQLNVYIRDCLESAFADVWLEGEISNLAQPSSGHRYFSLKDEQAQIACVLFKGQSLGLHLPVRELAHGLQVRVHGRVSLYTVRGTYQLIVDQIERTGAGELEQEYQKRFARLSALGLFAPEGKPPLPTYPKRIGVISSLSAAALQDVLSVLKRRNPLVDIVIYPSLVQGQEAAGQLIQQLKRANARAEVDLLLLIRGGGSLEDLWAFNDEALCHSIAASKLPVVTGIGHETDTTLADFCATLRAPTPTAAAELCCPTLERQQQQWQDQQSALNRAMRARLKGLAQSLLSQSALTQAMMRYVRQQQERLQYQSALLQRQNPIRVHHQASQYLDELEQRLQQQIGRKVQQQQQQWQSARAHLQRSMQYFFQQKQQIFAQQSQHLAHLSPLAVVGRGFALVQDTQGKLVRRQDDVHVNQSIRVRLSDAQLDCVVQKVSGLDKVSTS